MDIEQYWEKAQKKTEIIRGRAKALPTFQAARVPYIFLAESAVNEGNTVVRKGKIIIEKPMILLPEDLPQFDGFDFEDEMDLEQGTLQMFFLMRGIRFPSLKYNHRVDRLDLDEDGLSKCIEKYKKELERKENVNTALIIGPEDCWQFSILIYMGSLVGRCVRNDIMNLMDKFRTTME
ncbi:MAG: hypothetical protein KAI70_05145 [Candidatus Omnitrophica bacterium]|nr:hypothetical protein [Candidatus Omnitrophota bacterium]